MPRRLHDGVSRGGAAQLEQGLAGGLGDVLVGMDGRDRVEHLAGWFAAVAPQLLDSGTDRVPPGVRADP